MTFYLRFKPHVVLKSFDEERITVSDLKTELNWHFPRPQLSQTLKLLMEKEVSETALSAHWDLNEFSEFFYLIGNLKKRGWLFLTLYDQETPFCEISSHVEISSFVDEKKLFQLSRFAYLHRQDQIFVCETPLAAVLLKLLSPEAAAVLSSLAMPSSLEDLQKRFSNTSRECLENFLGILRGASLLEEENQALLMWEFHDLLFHSRSRFGRHDDPTGGTYPYLNTIPSLPLFKSMPEETVWLPLFKPDLQEVLKKDPPFTQVLEMRKSIRKQGVLPITSQQLGEFLYRTAHPKETVTSPQYEAIRRPSPGGGACHELEIYPLVYQCEGISQGLYFYQPEKHALALIQEWNSDVEELAIRSAQSIGSKDLSQIVLLIAARFGRVSWKYRSIAYSTVLKDTGALMQTMYLVATAMELAPCAVGCGDSDLFSRAAKTNYYEETTVGEFVIGTKFLSDDFC